MPTVWYRVFLLKEFVVCVPLDITLLIMFVLLGLEMLLLVLDVSFLNKLIEVFVCFVEVVII